VFPYIQQDRDILVFVPYVSGRRGCGYFSTLDRKIEIWQSLLLRRCRAVDQLLGHFRCVNYVISCLLGSVVVVCCIARVDRAHKQPMTCVVGSISLTDSQRFREVLCG